MNDSQPVLFSSLLVLDSLKYLHCIVPIYRLLEVASPMALLPVTSRQKGHRRYIVQQTEL